MPQNQVSFLCTLFERWILPTSFIGTAHQAQTKGALVQCLMFIPIGILLSIVALEIYQFAVKKNTPGSVLNLNKYEPDQHQSRSYPGYGLTAEENSKPLPERYSSEASIATDSLWQDRSNEAYIIEATNQAIAQVERKAKEEQELAGLFRLCHSLNQK